MAERIDNPWWSEGWRLVRERLPEILTLRRKRTLAVLMGASALVGLIGGSLLASAVDEPDEGPTWPLVAVTALLIVQLSVSTFFIVWGRQDRESDYRAGRVSIGLEDVFDLHKPVPSLSAELREEATIHVQRTRRALPASILGFGLLQLFLPIVLVIMAVSGWWSVNAWILLVQLALNGWQPFWLLKLLGSTTAQLRRIEAAPEPPTYIGPKGWKIEAPRKATEGDSTPG